VEEAMAQLADAQQRASAAEQRAASVESVREELEVRVAQLGTKAGELEQRATELEASLNEANAGGDAVRAEIATLTAALSAANARVTELESAPPAPPVPNEEDQAEIARLRGELANHMERAQAAEERVASLEADVLAAERGVSALPAEAALDRASQTVPDESANDRLAERFETSRPEIETDEPDQVVAQEPEVRQPEGREPEAREVEWEAPQPEGVAAAVAEAMPETPEPRGEELSFEPVDRWGSFAAAVEADDDDVASVASSETSQPEQSAPDEAVVTAVSSSDPSELEQGEDRAPVPSEPGPIAGEISEPEPVEEERPVEEEQVHEPALSTPAVEWHATPATPETTPASPNGNGVPPAPSDDARYDDIWTAAFAPPEPQPDPVHSGSQPVSDEATTDRHVSEDATPRPDGPEEPSPNDGAGSSETAVSADDQPSPPEDELSAEDDMWSLRARLADAAARKHLPHETTER
jgi:hypothetical protein